MTKMDTLPRGDSPPAPRLGSQMYLHENVTDAAQKMSPQNVSEEWSDLRRATGIIGFLTIVLAGLGIQANFEIKKTLESFSCINDHEPRLSDVNLSHLSEYSCSYHAKGMLLNLSAFLLVTTATEAFIGIVLIHGVLERARLLLDLWALCTIFWIATHIVSSVFFLSYNITVELVIMTLGPACIVTVLGTMALWVVLLYWVQLLSEEKRKKLHAKHGKNQASKKGDKDESSKETSVPFLEK